MRELSAQVQTRQILEMILLDGNEIWSFFSKKTRRPLATTRYARTACHLKFFVRESVAHCEFWANLGVVSHFNSELTFRI